MDPKSEAATVGATSGLQHASGDALLAVAEGNAESQPDEATLEHIFSCDRCSQNVRDIRASLAVLGVGAIKKPAAPKPAAAPIAASGPVDPHEVLASMPPLDAQAEEDPARKMLVKVVLVGIVLAAALYFLRSFAGGLR